MKAFPSILFIHYSLSLISLFHSSGSLPGAATGIQKGSRRIAKESIGFCRFQINNGEENEWRR